MANIKLKITVLRMYLIAGYVTASITPYVTPYRYDCSKAEYTRCVNLADPLIREPNLIFPDNMDDIDSVCRTWNQFVDCLKRYTDNCFTDQQRRIFNKAVENPIESVHQMCTQTSYQTEYLKYATCIKSTVTEMSHCGVQYSLLVEQVSKGDAIARASLCCSHHRFKQCVIRETQRLCDSGVPNGNAARFSSQIIDKALSFLQEQCFNYIPNSGDCPITPSTIDQLYTGSSLNNDVKSTWRSNVGSGSTYSLGPMPTDPGGLVSGGGSISNIGANTIPDGGYHQGVAGSGSAQSGQHIGYPEDEDKDPVYKQITNQDGFPPDQSTEVSWLPAQNAVPHSDNNGMTTVDQNHQSTLTIFNSPRTRPSSYGRSSSWTPAQSSDSTEKPSWATISTWHLYSQDVEEKHLSATETWYPAAGSYAGNSIDEPNQQGLSKLPNNFGTKLYSSHILIYTTMCVILKLLNN